MSAAGVLAAEAATAPVRRHPLRAALATPAGVAAAVFVVAVVVLALLAPTLFGEAAGARDLEALNAGPSLAHPAGTDSSGRDVLARVLVATQLSVGLALAATAIAVSVGVLLGTLPLLAGRRLGGLLVAAIDVAVAFPALLLAIFFAVVFGVGQLGAVLALGAAGGPFFARLVHRLSDAVARRDFVAAARVNGVGRLRVVTRHVLPNVAEPLVVNATIAAGLNLLAFSGLSYIGIGVQPPSFDWGRLLNEGLNQIYLNPMAAVAPGVAIVIAGLAFNLAGEVAAQALGRRGDGIGDRRVPVVGAAPDEAPDEARTVDGRDLSVWVAGPGGRVAAVRGVDLVIARGERVGVVGESGAGKSLLALSLAGLLQEPTVVGAERLRVAGHDLLAPGAAARMGQDVAVVFQDPMSSLNPTMRVGAQLAEVPRRHGGATRGDAAAAAVGRLGDVRLPEPAARARQYPHELSGGMRQRAMIAMGLMGTPRLLVADEPTTALDVTVQRQVLEVLEEARMASGAALLLISHDLAVVAEACDRVLIMYAGRIVEDLPAERLVTDARHPYTRALVGALPDLATPRDRPLATIPGRPPEPGRFPDGCAFAPRCPRASDRCRAQDPRMGAVAPDHRFACWNPHADSAHEGATAS